MEMSESPDRDIDASYADDAAPPQDDVPSLHGNGVDSVFRVGDTVRVARRNFPGE